MSFTDQKRHVATTEDVQRRWGLRPNGTGFRCYLCGVHFVEGSGFRWVYMGRHSHHVCETHGIINFLTCDECDGPDVIDRWIACNVEYYTATKFWALRS